MLYRITQFIAGYEGHAIQEEVNGHEVAEILDAVDIEAATDAEALQYAWEYFGVEAHSQVYENDVAWLYNHKMSRFTITISPEYNAENIEVDFADYFEGYSIDHPHSDVVDAYIDGLLNGTQVLSIV